MKSLIFLCVFSLTLTVKVYADCYGYPCCSHCDIALTDNKGVWGVENNQWCGIKETCEEKCYGYPCCSHCDIALTDNKGVWGVENNQWCGINDSCIKNEGNEEEEQEEEKCYGFPCCKTCEVSYIDYSGIWGNDEDISHYCGLRDSCEVKENKYTMYHYYNKQGISLQNYLCQMSPFVEDKIHLLVFTGNKISEIPECLSKLTNLRHLNLKSNKITSIPESLCELKNLEFLDLSDNKIEKIPDCIFDLNIKTLNINENKLDNDIVCNTIDQTSLTLNINNIPKCITSYTKLESLDLKGDGSSPVPEIICELNSLNSLSINNSLNIPECIFDLNLKYLKIQNSNLTTIPDSICKSENLRTLELQENLITELPSCMSKLTDIFFINLNKNLFTTFPEVVCNLKNIESLYISDNHIKFIPECIGEITELRKLTMDDNDLELLPESLNNLPHLNYIQIFNNSNLHGKILTNPSLSECFYGYTQLCYDKIHPCMGYPTTKSIDNIPFNVSPIKFINHCKE